MAKPGPRKSRHTKPKREERRQTKSVDKMLEKVERRGGARVGAGRPPGSKAIAKRILNIRDITTDIIKSGKVPLRVMVNNMIYYDEKAVYLQEEMETALAENMNRFSPDQFQKCLELMIKLGDARMSAQKCACDAAPFLHPRLSAIQMNVTKTEHPRDLPRDASIEQYRDDFRRLRSQPLAPIEIDGEVVDVEPDTAD